MAAQPLARVEGVNDPELRAAIEAVIGERASEGNGASSDLRDARTAASRARRLLRSRGYYGLRVDPLLDPATGAIIRVSPGPVFTIGEIAVDTGTDADSLETARSALALAPGAPLRAQAVIDAEARGLDALQTSGWPDAALGERRVIVDHASTTGSVRFRYAPGAFTTYGQVRVAAGDWHPPFIARISPLETGTPASREDMLEYQRRLDALESVRTARVTLGDPGDDGQRPVEVELEPAARHTIETGLNYSTSEGPGADISWTRRNLFGSDETLIVDARLATLNTSLSAQISRPHWRRFDQTLFVQAGIAQENTDAYEQDEIAVSAEINRRVGERRRYGAGTRLDASRLRDASGERDFLTSALDLVASYDSRTTPLDPSDGIRASATVSPTAVFGDESGQYLRAEVSASAYQPLGDDLVAAMRVRAGSLVGASAIDLPADERFFAGGGGSARGFEYQSIGPLGPSGAPLGGLSVAEISTELRWRVNRRWGAVAFVDSATASAERTPDWSEMRSAFGLGARYYFDFAPVRIDLATPLDRRDGEAPVQVYVSIGQAF